MIVDFYLANFLLVNKFLQFRQNFVPIFLKFLEMISSWLNDSLLNSLISLSNQSSYRLFAFSLPNAGGMGWLKS